MPRILRTLSVTLALVLLAAACSSDGGGGTTVVPTNAAPDASTTVLSPDTTPTTAAPDPDSPFVGSIPAPEFPDGLDWLNTGGPLALADLRGKVVLLDFWTYGCINCIHIIPDLKRLEQEFAEELVVIGVHSAKFDQEGETTNIRDVVLRYDLEHPVINDSEFEVWRTWGARAWPTVVLIDPTGNVIGGHSGEGIYPIFQPTIAGAVAEFERRGQIDRTPLDLSLEKQGLPRSILSYPGKVLADAEEGRLFVADTNHHRIVVADLASGEVLDVAGTGLSGFQDGDFAAARFDQPQGMALSADGNSLYVADTGSHAIRVLDLEARTVGTLAGTGYQAPAYPPRPGVAPDVPLNSPWALERDGTRLYVAMAGSHQIWSINLDSGLTEPVAGSGAEGTTDGDSAAAALAQPSGLALGRDNRLFFADSESSTVRYVEDPFFGGPTGLLAGSGDGLFDFGDVDGVGTAARLQHPLGLAFEGESLFVADTYNSKIKRIDPATGETTTFAGGDQGWRDGDDPQFSEPGGIAVAAGLLYVADTNNHAVRLLDPGTGRAETLVLSGIERFSLAMGDPAGSVIRLDPVTVAPGAGSLVVEVILPEGFKPTPLAPFTMAWEVEGGVATLGADADRAVLDPLFPIEIPARFASGAGVIAADLAIYYCSTDAESLCFLDEIRLEVAVLVAAGGVDRVVLTREVPAVLPTGFFE